MLNLILIIGFYLLVSGLRPFYCPVELRFCVRSYSDISVRFSPIFAGKKKNDKFVVHPNCKKEIVSIEKLGKYLDLNNKLFNISCPICNKKYTLAEDNIKKIINVQNNKIQFNCKHIESEDYITQMPFSIDLKDYFESNTKEMKKIMFFVNNFKRLTLNAQ